MELVEKFKGTQFDEQSLHTLAKNLIGAKNGDEEDYQRVLDEFMDGLSEEKQKVFGERFYDEIKTKFVTEKINKVLALHLNSEQIQKLRNVLMAGEEFDASRDDMLLALIQEFSQDSSIDQAHIKIESVFVDLQHFNKKNPGWLEKVEKSMAKIANFNIIHDEM
ncbi:unnamed protein product [Caenorhabditis angaria]|uniref:Uncharacterized protein n=1 Tax=Caenorhabditis angaria TaxID=860376 RepID=A0A9P1MV54_9PELO|nr:unnamed protein product [Caenorhabditis angaria]